MAGMGFVACDISEVKFGVKLYQTGLYYSCDLDVDYSSNSQTIPGGWGRGGGLA